MKNQLFMGAALAVILTVPSFAQQATAGASPTAQWVEIEDKNLMLADWQITIDQAEDLHVPLAHGTRVGEVEEIVGTNATTPEAVIVELDNFAGLDDVDVVFPIADLAVAQGKLFTELIATMIPLGQST